MHSENIMRVLDQATSEQREKGLQWYPRAHGSAARLAVKFDVSLAAVAGVVAALSPRVAWTKNLEYAARLLKTGDAPCLRRPVAKAQRILAGEDPESVLTGPKERAFFLCIRDPSHPEAVCVDRHAIDVACGQRHNERTRPRIDPRVKGDLELLEAITGAFRIVAQERGMVPNAVQAITWVVWSENLSLKSRVAH